MHRYLEPVARACAFLTKGSIVAAIGFACRAHVWTFAVSSCFGWLTRRCLHNE